MWVAPAAAFAASPVNFGLPLRKGSIKITAAPSSMRKAEWPSQIRFMGGPIQSAYQAGGEDHTHTLLIIHEINIHEDMYRRACDGGGSFGTRRFGSSHRRRAAAHRRRSRRQDHRPCALRRGAADRDAAYHDPAHEIWQGRGAARLAHG